MRVLEERNQALSFSPTVPLCRSNSSFLASDTLPAFQPPLPSQNWFAQVVGAIFEVISNCEHEDIAPKTAEALLGDRGSERRRSRGRNDGCGCRLVLGA